MIVDFPTEFRVEVSFLCCNILIKGFFYFFNVIYIAQTFSKKSGSLSSFREEWDDDVDLPLTEHVVEEHVSVAD